MDVAESETPGAVVLSYQALQVPADPGVPDVELGPAEVTWQTNRDIDDTRERVDGDAIDPALLPQGSGHLRVQ